MTLAPSHTQTQAQITTGRLLLFIILVALTLRLAVIPLSNFEDLMDADHIHAWEQGNVARALVSGHGFGSPFVSSQTSAIMPPVYPLIVAGFFLVFGVHTPNAILAIHIFDCVINSLACIPIFLIARRNFGEKAAVWAAWAWAFSPYGIYFSAAWAWSTHLLLLCLCWLLYLAQDLEQSSKLKLWAGFGLLAGFTGLTEPSILVVVPFLMVLAAWSLAREGKRWMLPGAVASLILAATISPWLIRDAVLFHRFIPMRDSMGLELWMGNNGRTLHWTNNDLHPLHDAQELAEYDRLGEVAYMDHKTQQAAAYIMEHREWYAWMCARRAIYLWTGYWSFNPAYLTMEPMDPGNIVCSSGLLLLAVMGLIAAWRRNKLDALRFGAVLFLFPLMYYFVHPEAYRMRPIDPLIVILGSFAVVRWRERAKIAAAVPAVPAAVVEA